MSTSNVPPVPSSPHTGLRVLYLGISGVLQPSESLYRLLNGRSPWDDGHTRYESAPALEQALRGWPDVRIVLSSTQPWKYGLDATLEELGVALASRVIGFTFEDLTTRAQRAVPNIRTGAIRVVGYSVEDYWRMNKSHIVMAHVEWLQPSAWVAVDDEDTLWPFDVRRDHLALTDGCEGLRSASSVDRLLTVLGGNFGPPVGLTPLSRSGWSEAPTSK